MWIQLYFDRLNSIEQINRGQAALEIMKRKEQYGVERKYRGDGNKKRMGEL